ncbi:MAG: phospholipase [Firmicutes bacterium]|nr:phospholipase [Bacillota bacterium]
MKKKIEAGYGKAVSGVFYMVNPVKKMMMKTNCTVHKFITMQAVIILKNDGYKAESDYFRTYISSINKGVQWADQDFKSSNHFYHHEKGVGLYGRSDLLTETIKAYNKALSHYEADEIQKAMFDLGVALHLVQDATVPHHVNNKLLKSHRAFELWIVSRLMSDFSFATYSGTKKYDSIEDFVEKNAVMANEVYRRNVDVASKDQRYENIAVAILQEAQRTTAGMMLKFYEDIQNLKVLPQ